MALKKLLFVSFVLLPFVGWNQIHKSDFYLVARFGIGTGMSEYTYTSTINGNHVNPPKSIKIDMGSGLIPEFGIGINLKRNLFVEYTMSYFFNDAFYETASPSGTSTQGHSFNRFSFGLNGKYFVEISSKFSLDFSVGGSYYIPEELTMELYGIEEKIDYVGAIGAQAGFGGNYYINTIYLNAGIRYRYESYSKKANQTLPADFNALNPQMDFINSNGIDIVFSVIYPF